MDLRRIQDDLRGFFQGDVLFDDINCQLYSTDASIFRVKPAGVVRPVNEEDLGRLVRYAQDQALPLIARGAGSGLGGESLGSGLVVDLSKHFRQIVSVHSDSVIVQPGVTLAALNATLAEHSRQFAPDPASGEICTVGGMLATNASGLRAVRYGRTIDHVLGLRTVLDNGDVVSMGRATTASTFPGLESHFNDILTTLGVLLEQHSDEIASSAPRIPMDRLGYALQGVLHGQVLDLPRLLVGSEGTLALTTEATLATTPIPGGRSLLQIHLASLEQAIQLVQRILPAGPSACDVADRRLLSLARLHATDNFSERVALHAEAVIFVEFEANSPAVAERLATQLAGSLSQVQGVIQTGVSANVGSGSLGGVLHELSLSAFYGARSGAHPISYVDDVGVPVTALHEFLRRTQDILQEHETIASFLVHAATGQVHTRPFLDPDKPDDMARLWSIAERVHRLAIELGGTVSSRYGTGLARTSWVARQCGPLYSIMRQVKAIFDPKRIFNPGKIVDPDLNQPARPFRFTSGETALEKPLALNWNARQLAQEVSQCNGCGQCRTEQTAKRMCPIFRATRDEASTPRAKANVLRDFLQQITEDSRLGAEEVRAVADLCVHCKMCSLECPASVNVPRLMIEAKAANVRVHGMDRPDWFFSQVEQILRWAGTTPFVANLALRSRSMRWILDKLFGVSAKRRLPGLASRSFLANARRHGLTQKPGGVRPTVVYFVDLWANFLEPQIAEATVAVLQHLGMDVFVPPDQCGSGLEAYVHGDLDSARDSANRNLRALVEPARAGWPIVCSEPSAAVMLQQEYPNLHPDADARIVADRTIELMNFLGRLHDEGRLRSDFGPLAFSIGHHVPCHVKALGGEPRTPTLMKLIPALRVHTIDVGCSGMAGTFGLKSANHALSVQAGEEMLTQFRRPQSLFGSSECGSCRLQMEDQCSKKTLHPIQYMAMAYGLLPDLVNRLREPIS